MNIDYKLKAKADHVLVVEYDAKARAAFTQALPVAQEIWSDPKIREATEPHGIVFQSRITAGLEVLRLLSENAARNIELPDSDAQAAFDVAVLSTEAGRWERFDE